MKLWIFGCPFDDSYLTKGEFRLFFEWAVIWRFEDDGGGAGVTLNEPFDDNVNAVGISTIGFELFEAFVWVTIKFSFITCCDCFSFFNKTNLVSSFLSSSLNFLSPLSRSHISAADNSCRAGKKKHGDETKTTTNKQHKRDKTKQNEKQNQYLY